MKDQHSNSDDPVPATPEVEEPDYGFADYGTPSPFSPEYWLHFLDDLTEEDDGDEGPHLISVDELRAAGALDFPPGWRTSLHVERTPFTGLFREEHFNPDEPDSTPAGKDDEESADEHA